MLRFALLPGLALSLRDDAGRLSLDTIRDTDGYVIDAEPCNAPKGSEYCNASVQSQLSKIGALQDPGSRIGAVLAVQDFLGSKGRLAR
ncbi:unnamed protein product [Symbiodinium pilosum]|uniref:Uncharacterized protein n=1 Tax=Symbiodinium pilosum TaxID=2952 RepID=A0A812WYG8_SYMPI|nr:unnamed protein product [Symbiodinium pilosum]